MFFELSADGLLFREILSGGTVSDTEEIAKVIKAFLPGFQAPRQAPPYLAACFCCLVRHFSL